jgi:hypothetical protein
MRYRASPMIHTGWFRQGQPRSRAAAQKLVDRILRFQSAQLDSGLRGCAWFSLSNPSPLRG